MQAMAEHDAVWAQTTDGGLLHQLFGHYPSLHEALIRAIQVDGKQRTLSILLDYVDQADGDRLAARVTLHWSGVKDLDLPLDLEHLVSLGFRQGERELQTQLETWPGVFGTIRSEGFEAILEQLQPGSNDETPRLRLTYER